MIFFFTSRTSERTFKAIFINYDGVILWGFGQTEELASVEEGKKREMCSHGFVSGYRIISSTDFLKCMGKKLELYDPFATDNCIFAKLNVRRVT